MSIVISEDRYEHRLDLVILRNFSLEYHISEFDRLLFDAESRELCDTEFHIVRAIIGELYRHGVTEWELAESFIDKDFEIREARAFSDERDDHG